MSDELPNKEHPMKATWRAQGRAKGSWISPLIGFFIDYGSRTQPDGDPAVTLTVVGIVFLTGVIGLVLAILALRDTKKHGRAGIFGHAIAGLTLSCILLALFLLGVVAALIFST